MDGKLIREGDLVDQLMDFNARLMQRNREDQRALWITRCRVQPNCHMHRVIQTTTDRVGARTRTAPAQTRANRHADSRRANV
jgi:hypothetical protein